MFNVHEAFQSHPKINYTVPVIEKFSRFQFEFHVTDPVNSSETFRCYLRTHEYNCTEILWHISHQEQKQRTDIPHNYVCMRVCMCVYVIEYRHLECDAVLCGKKNARDS